MEYLETNSTDSYYNLAFEEYVFNNVLEGDFFMLWQNSPAVIVGRHQNTVAEINAAYIREHDISVVRRITGGGAVYHDLGNLNFSFISPVRGNATINFRRYIEPIMGILAGLGVDGAEFSSRNDITIKGCKVSGNAQYIHRGRVLHHGTLLFNSDLSALSNAVSPSKAKISSKGIRSVRNRVGNISGFLPDGVTLERFKAELLAGILANGGSRAVLTPAQLDEVKTLMEQKYSTWDWNYGRSPSYDVRGHMRFEGGEIESLLTVEKGKITGCRFYGDFFGHGNIDIIESALCGEQYEHSAIRRALYRNEIDIPMLIFGMTADTLCGLLCSEL